MKTTLFSSLLLIFCLLSVACSHTLDVSEYYYDGRIVQRKDMDNVMTELKYYDKDGNEMGATLFHYPGRDGWFLVDIIWDTDKMYLLLCDACPKIIITDSAHFAVIHDMTQVEHVDKSRWIRISSNDDIPVVRRQNNQYQSKIRKRKKTTESKSTMPNWADYAGEFYKE